MNSAEKIRSEIRNLAQMAERLLFILAGCNGAGKTTATHTLLPDLLPCLEFVNADEIARGLSPFQPDQVAVQAGRIMLQRMEDLTVQAKTFAFETTLSGRTYLPKIKSAKKGGYTVVLIFFWLPDVDLAKSRVRQRVMEGGHGIPEQAIVRRYYRGIRNLFNSYLPEVDMAYIVDSSAREFSLIARQTVNSRLFISDFGKFQTMKTLLS